MARPKMFYKYELPQGVIKMVRAICADYERRKLALAAASFRASQSGWRYACRNDPSLGMYT